MNQLRNGPLHLSEYKLNRVHGETLKKGLKELSEKLQMESLKFLLEELLEESSGISGKTSKEFYKERLPS